MLFNLHLTRKLFVLLEKFSKELQAVDKSSDYAFYSLQHILQRVQEMRNEREFERILDEARNVPGVETNPDGSRLGNIPRYMKCDDFIMGERLHTTRTPGEGITELLHRTYYEAIDVIVQCIYERFQQYDLSIVRGIEQILLKSMLERRIPINSFEHALIDKKKLKMQLDDLPTILGLYSTKEEKKITSISRISTITDIFNAMPCAKKQCS